LQVPSSLSLLVWDLVRFGVSGRAGGSHPRIQSIPREEQGSWPASAGHPRRVGRVGRDSCSVLQASHWCCVSARTAPTSRSNGRV